MRGRIDCFLACGDKGIPESTITLLRDSNIVLNVNLMTATQPAADTMAPEGCTTITIGKPNSSDTIARIAENTEAEYVLLCMTTKPVTFCSGALERMLRIARDADAALTYCDRMEENGGTTAAHPTIDYQTGSIRDDFDFGPIMMIKGELLKRYAAEAGETAYEFAGLYDLRLFLSREGSVFHINEYLYTLHEDDTRTSGEKQFDYVNPNNRAAQIEMEQAATHHIREIGAAINPMYMRQPDFDEQDFEYEASVIIPVKNRVATIADAVNSALSQRTNFKFNVIVIDNHSTDGTTELLQATDNDRLIHIIPESHDLGIGGCWNKGINDGRCGRFAVQLDSDDLYSSPDTLQKIIDCFYKDNAAMVIGSYRICDFDLNTLPPGLIDHKEWTDSNGGNNALRINGLGAPRAFFTPLLRQIQFPNTSYGEDYAMGLIFSRCYKIGRIYDELYLCRRWAGNSDAALSIEKTNANNIYKDKLRSLEISARQQISQGKDGILPDSQLQRFFNRQLETWETARRRYRELQSIQTRELHCDNVTLTAQHNPARIVSTGASIDRKTIESRPCFLCAKNRPAEQNKKILNGYELLVNPFPILPVHFTIASNRHEPQLIAGRYGVIHDLLTDYPELTIFYNGPQSGASAPDHAHFQAAMTGVLPLQKCWQRLCRNLCEITTKDENEGIWTIPSYPGSPFVVRSRSKATDQQFFSLIYKALPAERGSREPMMNIVSWRNGDEFISIVFARSKHRPDCYHDNGADGMLVSPGALDMAGLVILPREEDFRKITPEAAAAILREVSLGKEDMEKTVEKIKSNARRKFQDTFANEEPEVLVGIVCDTKISFALNSPYTAKGETIEGCQTVEFSEGGILWNGYQYRELTFTPQSEDASFSLHNVTIGHEFHWERKETQTFNGTLKLVVEADKIMAINQLPVEKYLMSVISSEMKATSSAEFLKAHAVISRSWLLAQMEKRKQLKEKQNSFFSFIRKDDEIIRWYDREDHAVFDVCADDHCQRYQGITKAANSAVENAVRATKGKILTYDDEICDARFSKCCGGISEEFQYCWENASKPYLAAIRDSHNGTLPDLTKEEEAEKWIRSNPESFCNTVDKKILTQVLNDYDQETNDFYRWEVEYGQEQLATLISNNMKDDFGEIVDLIATERGRSGRISKLKIVGTKKTFTIGKELEIRRVLSDTHLYSSAFVVDREDIKDGIPGKFILRGAGWGHGVGLCQIGAAVMGEKGYTYDKILLHYYQGAKIETIYI